MDKSERPQSYEWAINSIRAYDGRDLKFSDNYKDWNEGYRR
jgi:hypothetical protein